MINVGMCQNNPCKLMYSIFLQLTYNTFPVHQGRRIYQPVLILMLYNETITSKSIQTNYRYPIMC